MSVQTSYDNLRDSIRDDLKDVLTKSRELLDQDIFGAEDMTPGYAIEVIKAISDAIDEV